MNTKWYNLIFYEEETVQRFTLSVLTSKGKITSQVKYAYILHDKDIIENTGELKKPHYHLWLEFDSQIKDSFIKATLENIGASQSALSHQKTDRNFLAYLTHNTPNSNEIKQPYDYSNIITNIDSDIFNEMYNDAVATLQKKVKPSKADRTRLIWLSLRDIVSAQRFTDMRNLMDYLADLGMSEEFDYCLKRYYAVDRLLKSEFTYNYKMALKEQKMAQIKYDCAQLDIELAQLDKQQNEVHNLFDKKEILK